MLSILLGMASVECLLGLGEAGGRKKRIQSDCFSKPLFEKDLPTYRDCVCAFEFSWMEVSSDTGLNLQRAILAYSACSYLGTM